MGNSRLKSIFNILASVALLIGIALVILELQQTRELTRLQINQESLATAQNEFMARYGDDVSSSMAKACTHPEELDNEDAFALDALFRYHLHFIARQKMKGELGPYTFDWEGEAKYRIGFVLGFPQGREWIKLFSSRDPDVARFLEKDALLVSPIPCLNVLKAFVHETS